MEDLFHKIENMLSCAQEMSYIFSLHRPPFFEEKCMTSFSLRKNMVPAFPQQNIKMECSVVQQKLTLRSEGHERQFITWYSISDSETTIFACSLLFSEWIGKLSHFLKRETGTHYFLFIKIRKSEFSERN